jgi:predicted ferric reductase
MRHTLRGLFWITVYVTVALAPVLVARLDASRPEQGFVTDFSVALGFAALAIMVLQFGLVARLARVSAPFGIDALIQYHRQIGFVGLAFALLHPALVFANDPAKFERRAMRQIWTTRFVLITAALLAAASALFALAQN